MGRRTKAPAGVVALLCAFAISPATANAQEIAAGFDLFVTDPQSTQFEFQGTQTTIPPGFFGPGSDPFQGSVHFGGVPLNTFGGHNVGDADTVVQRLGTGNPPSQPNVPIEIVALNLVSVQPITVTYNGGQSPEQWTVGAGLSEFAPSPGQMTVIRDSEQGGTFNSQLRVVPRFVFTRVNPADGQTNVLDVALLPQFQQPQFQNQLILMAANVPWRAGCVLPALAVAGLNDGFCPGLTTTGQKILTVEQAALARHGIFPAQPPGTPEHFKCYQVKPRRFSSRTVTLTDQFGTRTATLNDRGELCNPAQKNQEPLSNTAAHLVCYAAPGPPVNRQVAVQNQFGSQILQVLEPQALCVPSQKRRLKKRTGKPKGPFPEITTPIDHYQCYAVAPQSQLFRVGALGPITINDQFGTENVQVGPPVQICTPTQKNQEVIQHPVKHLVCYEISDRKKKIGVQIANQFERKKLKPKLKPNFFCVPTNKVAL